MIIPESLKIGGHTYSVVLTDDQKLLEGALACMSEHQGIIWVDSSAPQTIQGSSLLHEIFHAMGTTISESEFGHALLDALAEQLYQVLSDNDMLK